MDLADLSCNKSAVSCVLLDMKLSAHTDLPPVNPEFKRVQPLPDVRAVSSKAVPPEEMAVAAVERSPQFPAVVPGSESLPGRVLNEPC